MNCADFDVQFGRREGEQVFHRLVIVYLSRRRRASDPNAGAARSSLKGLVTILKGAETTRQLCAVKAPS